MVTSPTASALPVPTAANETTACNISDQLECWGDNYIGLLANGDFYNTDVPGPTALTGSAAPLTVVVGNNHVCTVLSGGDVACWGDNEYGQLGLGTQTRSAAPVIVAFP